jgi:hypothetical protein
MSSHSKICAADFRQLVPLRQRKSGDAKPAHVERLSVLVPENVFGESGRRTNRGSARVETFSRFLSALDTFVSVVRCQLDRWGVGENQSRYVPVIKTIGAARNTLLFTAFRRGRVTDANDFTQQLHDWEKLLHINGVYPDAGANLAIVGRSDRCIDRSSRPASQRRTHAARSRNTLVPSTRSVPVVDGPLPFTCV